MKLLLAAMATFAFTQFASADLPEMNDAYDAEAVFALSLTSSDSEHGCDESEKVQSTEWTCFARDARGRSLGVSTSFTKRHLAAGRAVASCQRKSSVPQTCRITRCKQPEPQCP